MSQLALAGGKIKKKVRWDLENSEIKYVEQLEAERLDRELTDAEDEIEVVVEEVKDRVFSNVLLEIQEEPIQTQIETQQESMIPENVMEVLRAPSKYPYSQQMSEGFEQKLKSVNFDSEPSSSVILSASQSSGPDLIISAYSSKIYKEDESS